MKINKNAAQIISLFLLGCALIVVYKVFDNLGTIGGIIAKLWSIMTPFIVGFGIAFLLFAPVKWLDERIRRSKWQWMQRAARPLAVTIVYLLAIALVSLVIYIAVPALIRAVGDFIEQMPTYYENALSFVRQHSQDGGLLAGFNLEEKVNELYKFLAEQLTVDRIVGYLSGVVKFASSLIDVLMAFIVSVYMLLGKESLIGAVKSVSSLVIKPKTMGLFSVYSHKIAKIFYNYFYSQIIDAFVVAVLATIGFLIAQIPNAPALGMMLGILNMIPYFGALIGGVICVLVALISGNFYGALFVGIYILVMQQIDANIIQPRIVGHTVGIRPIYVLLGITLGGGIFGFWGVFLGAPFIAVVQMLLSDCIKLKNKKAEKGDPIQE